MIDVKDTIKYLSFFGLVGTGIFSAVYFLEWLAYAEVISLFFLSTFIIFSLTYVFACILTRTGILSSDFKGIICESDWYPSLSNAQFLTWTFVVGIIFVWIFLIKLLYSYATLQEIDASKIEIPGNLLWLMGITSLTTLTSKGLSSVKFKGQKKKPYKIKNIWTMFMENGRPSLTRYQVFLWTSISVFTYFGLVFGHILIHYNDLVADLTFPNFPTILLALTGVSQATYLGGKLTFQPPEAGISRIVPEGGKIGDTITIYGFHFGKEKSSVLFDETIVMDFQDWKENMIRLKIPEGISLENEVSNIQVINSSGILTLPYEYNLSPGFLSE